jgi:hypothetical protein
MKISAALALTVVVIAATTAAASAGANAFLGSLTTLSRTGTTVPTNGDVNPYGIVPIQASDGSLVAGDLLVSNFNDKANDQGTGTTLVELSPSGGAPKLFARISAASLPGPCPGGVGLTTALAVLPGGDVVVGSLPTTNGKSATAQYGCLIVLDDLGKPVETLAGSMIQGPWDMTAISHGSTTTLFVSMALNGGAKAGVRVIKNSTVVRIVLSTAGTKPVLKSERVIADGFPWRDDPAALVIGPTGLALSASGTLYVANTLSDQIDAIPDAMTLSSPAAATAMPLTTGGHLKQPLGLIVAPNGDILTTNAGNGVVVETTTAGKQVAWYDTKDGGGALFGLAIPPGARGLSLVDDANNTVQQLH